MLTNKAPATSATTAAPARILRRPEVEHRVGKSRSTLYAEIKAGAFPKPIAIGARAVGWLEADIDAWIADQIAKSRSGQ